jgi:hypothetical protein
MLVISEALLSVAAMRHGSGCKEQRGARLLQRNHTRRIGPNRYFIVKFDRFDTRDDVIPRNAANRAFSRLSAPAGT